VQAGGGQDDGSERTCRFAHQRRCKKFGKRSEKSQSNSGAEGEPRRHEWGQRRCKKFEGRGEKSQSDSEAAGGPRTPESRRHEQGYCAPAGMSEGTVKVHVRQIMRKFGVMNRTQLAVVCANGRPSQKAATPAEF